MKAKIFSQGHFLPDFLIPPPAEKKKKHRLENIQQAKIKKN